MMSDMLGSTLPPRSVKTNKFHNIICNLFFIFNHYVNVSGQGRDVLRLVQQCTVQ